MNFKHYKIAGIPAVSYGVGAKNLLYIHGKYGSKEEAGKFAEAANSSGYRVIGIDLPGHGERKDEADRFVPWEAVPEITAVAKELLKNGSLSVVATSIGAWFSMLALDDLMLTKALFFSPVTDMSRLIGTMMQNSGVSADELAQKRLIPVSDGVLDYRYYLYANEHRNLHWQVPTDVLYPAKDNLTDRKTINEFAEIYECKLTVYDEGEHWFHTPEQLTTLDLWFINAL